MFASEEEADMRVSKSTVLAAVLAVGGYAGNLSSQSPPQTEARPAVERSVVEPHPSWSSPPLGIPTADLPSPGQCRVWIPGRAAERQSRSGRCSALQARVPAGAWLVHRPAGEPGRVRVTVNDPRPVYVVSVRLYEAETGRFIGEE